jgi:hypothetical protein
MPSCWASCLGDCSDKISREHLISRSLFLYDAVQVEGFPWCVGKTVEIGISSLTRKILCERHNNALSPLDDSAGHAFETLRQMTQLGNVRSRLKPKFWSVNTFTVDGRMLERWFLKTLINLTIEGDYPIGRDALVAGHPSERLVRIAFSLSSFQGRAGLYFIARVGMKMSLEDKVQFVALVKNGHHIEGGLFTFRGLFVLLFLEPDGPPEPLQGVIFNGEDIGNATLNFHNQRFKQTHGKYLSHQLRMKW